MSQTICRRRFGRVLTALAGALSLAAGASAQWILIDDFNAGHDDAWTHVDLLEGTPWGPTIYDASTFEYHISSTESIPPQGYYLWTGAFWTESADNWRYSEGIVRAKIRMDTAATHPFLGMRVVRRLTTAPWVYSSRCMKAASTAESAPGGNRRASTS